MPKGKDTPGTTVAEQNTRSTALAQFDDSVSQDSEQFGNNFKQTDLVVPRLRILQSLSPQLKKSEAAYLEDANEGDFFITGSGELYRGDEGLLVIPVYHTISVTEWKPDNGGFVADHGTNEALEKTTTRNDKNKNILPNGNEILVANRYFLLILGNEDSDPKTAVFDLKVTQRKKARAWNSILDSVRHTKADGSKIRVPLFYSAARLTSIPEKNPKGQAYMGVKIDPAGKTLELPNGPVLYAAAKSLRELIQQDAVKASPEEETTQGATEEPVPF